MVFCQESIATAVLLILVENVHYLAEDADDQLVLEAR
jgi:ActR/RegA family two-component response regulator